MTIYQFAIIQYPNSLKSAIYGLEEMFILANRFCQEAGLAARIETSILRLDSLLLGASLPEQGYHAVLIPPSLDRAAYETVSPKLIDWLNEQHKQGAILSSACAGAFFIAETEASKNRCLTTHWGLAEVFRQRFPSHQLDTSKILIDQGDIMTAGGMMSWMDLGIAMVQRFTQSSIVNQLSKTLVMDTGVREQSYYQQFIPRFDHGDQAVLTVQHYLQAHYSELNRIVSLAKIANLTPRTLLRRFHKYTGWTPSEYIQRLRIQAVCNGLEESTQSFESLAIKVGYENAGSCRKVFQKIMRLTPSEFRRRFKAAQKPIASE
ncbi:GlxA family transcriptional regulator [Marinomonas pollencensis]|nr:helix-turn-helix domain-containing protein [Marinomonas pollencensis]